MTCESSKIFFFHNFILNYFFEFGKKSSGEVSNNTQNNGGFIGGIVGKTNSGVENCTSSGNISGTFCSVTGFYFPMTFYVGGIIGYTDNEVRNCISSCNVSSNGGAAGGIAGSYNSYYLNTAISNCISSGNVSSNGGAAGGVVGSLGYTIKNCYFSGNVSGTGRVGGINGISYTTSITSNCYYNSDKTATHSGSGMPYYGSGSSRPLTTAQMTGADALTNMVGLDSTFTARANDENYCYYPQLTIFVDNPDVYVPWPGDFDMNTNWSGTGSELDPYIIQSVADLNGLASSVNSGTHYSGEYFSLTTDLDLDNNHWTPIGIHNSAFAGNFNGNNHTISNLYIDTDKDYSGLFGNVIGSIPSDSTSISNLSVEGSIIGEEYTGGVIGHAYGASITNCNFNGSVEGSCRVGGIVGAASTNSSIKNCVSDGDVYATSDHIGGIVGFAYQINVENCYSSGNVSGANLHCVGGVVGGATNSNITSCASSASVFGKGGGNGGVIGAATGATIAKCYSNGNVSGYSLVGGIIGRAYDNSIITNCYATGHISGTISVGGVVGQSEVDTANTRNLYYNNENSPNINPIGNVSNYNGYINVKGSITTQMTGLNALNNMVFSNTNDFTVKANDLEYIYYPQLTVFANNQDILWPCEPA